MGFLVGYALCSVTKIRCGKEHMFRPELVGDLQVGACTLTYRISPAQCAVLTC